MTDSTDRNLRQAARLYGVAITVRDAGGVPRQASGEAIVAVLRLESHRHQCGVVGEKPGRLPDGTGEPRAQAKTSLRRASLVIEAVDSDDAEGDFLVALDEARRGAPGEGG